MREVDFSSEYTFIKNEPNKEQRYRSLEGYLYPDTYDFYKGENASSVIRTFLNNFQKKWTDDYQKKADALNMSVDDIIKLASIIEKEAADATQMPLVSSVLHNRLNKPGLYPSLQCDSTADYINDYIAKNVTNATELAAYTSRYSTYKCEGLPVGAICNPGNDSINAALNPAKTDYYFFAHDTNKRFILRKTIRSGRPITLPYSRPIKRRSSRLRSNLPEEQYEKTTRITKSGRRFERFEAALRFGADAVYLAGSSFGMRAGPQNFPEEDLIKAVKKRTKGC